MKVISKDQVRMLEREGSEFVDDVGIDIFTEVLTHFDEFLDSAGVDDLSVDDGFLFAMFSGFVAGWICCIDATRARLH